MRKIINSKIDIIAIIILGIIGAFLRFYLINQIPCGLFPDQALNGLDALKFSDGLFSPVFGGKEGLFIYLIAISQIIFGTGIWQIFVVSALLGTVTIITTYLAIKEIFDRKIAFLSAFLLAVSSWHIALSRNGFRAIIVPLIISLFIYFLAKSFKSKSEKQEKIYYILTAGTFALGFYTYNAYLIFAFTTFLIALFFAFQNRKGLKKFLQKRSKAIINSLVIFAVVILPIALFILIFPDKYFTRAGQVSIFSEGTIIEMINLFLKNLWQTLIGVFYHGDSNWRHNPPGSPLLHPFLAPFFFITLGYAFLKNRKLLILFFIFLMMFLPAVLTSEGAPPHGLRLIGILPILFVIPAISLSLLLKIKRKAVKITSAVIIAVIMIVTAISGYRNYFLNAPFSAHYYNDFRCDLTAAASYIKNHDNVKIITDGFSFETIRYLLLPGIVEYELPEDFIREAKEKSLTSQEIIVLSSFGAFDEEILNLLSENFQKSEVINQFDSIDFYIFSKENK